MSDRDHRGLHDKFRVTRTDGASQPGAKHDGCEYFVLDVTHDRHARSALRSYALACAVDRPNLSADLLSRFGPPMPRDPIDVAMAGIVTASAAFHRDICSQRNRDEMFRAALTTLVAAVGKTEAEERDTIIADLARDWDRKSIAVKQAQHDHGDRSWDHLRALSDASLAKVTLTQALRAEREAQR